MTANTAGTSAYPERSPEDYKPLRVAAAIAAFFMLVMVIIMAKGLGHCPEEVSLHDGQIHSPILALELARNQADLEEVLELNCAVPSATGEQASGVAARGTTVCTLRTNTYQDCVLIPCYTATLVFLAWLFTVSPRRIGWRAIAATAAILVGLLDYVENIGIFQALAAPSLSDQLAHNIRYPSLGKWTLLGVTMLFLGAILWISRLKDFRPRVRSVLGIAFLIDGLMLLLALAWLPLFPYASGLFGLLLLVSAAGLMGPFFERQ